MINYSPMSWRKCFREPLPEIFEVAKFLSQAVIFHSLWDRESAKNIFSKTNNPRFREWVESIIGKKSPYINYRAAENPLPILPKDQRIPLRMPTTEEKKKIHERDGFFCRFCGMPVIRSEIRKKIIHSYFSEVPWWKTNLSRHAAFFAMWAQYDHILPHARWGDNSLDNLILTCSACNFGRMSYTLDEVWILFPENKPLQSIEWNGLEDFDSGSR